MTTEDVTAGAAVFAHPLRVEIVKLLAGRREASPSQLHGELGQPLGNVSYHVRQLAKGGVISKTRSMQRRGAVEHFYRLNGGMGAVKALRAATAEVLAAAAAPRGDEDGGAGR